MAAARNVGVQRKLQLFFEIRKGLKLNFTAGLLCQGTKCSFIAPPGRVRMGRCSKLAWDELQHPFSQGITLGQPILLHCGDVLAVISIAFWP